MGNCFSSDLDDAYQRQENAQRDNSLEQHQQPSFVSRQQNETRLCQNCGDQLGNARNKKKPKKLKNTDFIELLDNPQLLYNTKMLYCNDGIYGGKIYTGLFSCRQVSLKLIIEPELKAMEKEIKILSELSHFSIASILFEYESPDNNKYFLITEFLGHKLDESTINEFGDLQTKQVMHQLMDAIVYLQIQKIVHLEICPRNVFVRSNGCDVNVQIINFYKAREVLIERMQIKNDKVIDGFTAPEMFQHKFLYLSTDIYALGCLFFYIVTKGLRMIQIQHESQEGKVNSRIDAMIPRYSSSNILCKDLITKMLTYSPIKRLTAQHLEDHPYFYTAKETVQLIIDVSKLTEKNQDFRTNLFKGGNRIIQNNWIEKLEPETKQVLENIRQARVPKTGTSSEEYIGKNIVHLVKTLRNILVHAQTDEISKIMGENDEDFLNYWNKKFPSLIMHLYKVKFEHDNQIPPTNINNKKKRNRSKSRNRK